MSLPELFSFHGDWARYEEELYALYLETIIQSRLTFRNLPVKAKNGTASLYKYFYLLF